MTLHLPENPFIGLNPHLMSLLQTQGRGEFTSLYPSFHSDHITHIKDYLNQILPAQYVAISEPSLQIRGREHEFDAPTRDSSPQPDIAIYRETGTRTPQATPLSIQPTFQFELQLAEPQTMMGIGIYLLETSPHPIYGEALVRLELLSPANMPAQSYGLMYQESRQKCLMAGTPLIEIDYLHEYPSPIPDIPRYPQEAASKPFYIALTNPQLKAVAVYAFGIQDPIPTVPIPLAEDEFLPCDFGRPFDYTWKTSRFGRYLDYSQEPVRMERYSPADQAMIRQVMQRLSE